MSTDAITILPPFQREVPPYVWYNKMFSAPECDELVRLGEQALMTPGSIGNGIDGAYVVDPGYRKVQTLALSATDVEWAYDKLKERVVATNADHFRYDIMGFHEQLILLRYDFDPEQPGKYKWHQDIGGGMSSLRKLSTVTNLSDPADYDGGRLRLFTNMDFDPGHVERGDTLIFPSYLPHCVTPLERGRRYSLVSWVTGHPFS